MVGNVDVLDQMYWKLMVVYIKQKVVKWKKKGEEIKFLKGEGACWVKEFLSKVNISKLINGRVHKYQPPNWANVNICIFQK